jgi:hypothetical protein
MKKVLIFLLVICFTNYTYSQKIDDTITYHWRGKIISKKKWDRLTYRYTVNFCKNYKRK